MRGCNRIDVRDLIREQSVFLSHCNSRVRPCHVGEQTAHEYGDEEPAPFFVAFWHHIRDSSLFYLWHVTSTISGTWHHHHVRRSGTRPLLFMQIGRFDRGRCSVYLDNITD